jgi:hypothetical protein
MGNYLVFLKRILKLVILLPLEFTDGLEDFIFCSIISHPAYLAITSSVVGQKYSGLNGVGTIMIIRALYQPILVWDCISSITWSD